MEHARDQIPTKFAPAARAGQETLEQEINSLRSLGYLQQTYDAVSDIVLILNAERQIVFFNKNLPAFMGMPSGDTLYGQRPGEALFCRHARETEGGCGTTEFCRQCGAVKAILACQRCGKEDSQECRIIQQGSGDALDLQVKTFPLDHEGRRYTIYAIKDISHEKRRRVLERIFFHDIMNSAVGVRGLSELISMADEEQRDEFLRMIHSGAAGLVEEIKAQKELAAAETNELAVQLVPLDSAAVLGEVRDLYSGHEVAQGKSLRLATPLAAIPFLSDHSLLLRVLGNMTKNGLEASEPGDTVTLGCEEQEARPRFWVHNPTVMPAKVKHQVFQRSFSTKGAGRGLGTYSMKLLGERYLHGEVLFSSRPGAGTCFEIILPPG